jgi:diketogulonate reductase-like aldo/keto reductase
MEEAMMKTDVTHATLPLAMGARIPMVGLGVWQSPAGEATKRACLDAFALGYRHVDTARIYGNEADVGAAVRESGIPREQIFVTTKLWNDDHGYDKALRAFDASLQRLGLDYVDLYLIHWPVGDSRIESWRALEKIFEEKRARAIGVSNFLVRHLEELLAKAKHAPAANQIELSPFLQRRDTVEFCKKNRIVLEAYSPLTRGKRLNDPVVVAVARRVGRTPAQVLLRWGVQHEFVVLPKSTKKERIAENGAIFDFELDAKAMQELDALDEEFTTGWDPATQP